MADIVILRNFKVSTVDTIERVFTAPSGGVIISAFTASNDSPSSVTYKAYIYDSLGIAVDPIIPQKIVVKDRYDLGPSIVNQVIPSGGTLRIENSAGDSLNFNAAGRSLA